MRKAQEQGAHRVAGMEGEGAFGGLAGLADLGRRAADKNDFGSLALQRKLASTIITQKSLGTLLRDPILRHLCIMISLGGAEVGTS